MSSPPVSGVSASTMSLADRYLARLGIERPTAPDLAGLKVVLDAHLRSIPFENLSSFSGTPVSVVREDVYAKLLEGRRGGYCMEHALLSVAALRDLGFRTENILARVYFGPNRDTPMGQTHAGTVVTFGDDEYLFDTGFGAYTPKMPIRLNGGDAEQVCEYGSYRVRPAAAAAAELGSRQGADETAVLETKLDDKWVPLYGFTRRPVVYADIEAFNWFVCTYPTSTFVCHIMLATFGGDVRVTAWDRNFKRRSKEGVEERVVENVEELGHWLRDKMGIGADDKLVEAVWAKLKDL